MRIISEEDAKPRDKKDEFVKLKFENPKEFLRLKFEDPDEFIRLKFGLSTKK
ncbi:MAG: hypothetical protein ACRCX7_09935 [Cetobacterium sp.]|uniref:hypothetical protein n=1 Tax=Cetobacterium sp. TaxID=2071632 RepID=UPI003F33BAD8